LKHAYVVELSVGMVYMNATRVLCIKNKAKVKAVWMPGIDLW